ncbi:MAG: magnesium transporter [Candidatus Omnitrophica bacterium]|nr:magnesium transporter [Candidatus Omnitrophota bacterium]
MAPEDSTVSLIKKFFELNPVDAAHSLEALSEEEAVHILKNVSPELSSRAFNSLEPRFAANLLLVLPDEIAAQIFGKMLVTRAAELVLCIQRRDDREKLLERIEPVQAGEIRKLTTYPEDTAGRIMTPNFLAFPLTMKADEAVQNLRSLAQKKSSLNYVYVTDSENRLKGVLNMRDLLLANEGDLLESIMIPDVFRVEATLDREKVIQELSTRSFVAVPVVDKNGHLLGTIRTDELIASAQEEATEDIQKMFGAGGDERVSSSISFSVKKRFFWLMINLGTAFLASAVISVFEGTIARITALAVFLPIVASQGGNTGAQSLAVVIRGLVLREIEPRLARKVIFKEGALGLINGSAVGTLSALVAWLWNGNIYLGLVIGLAMVVNMVAAGISGAAIPIFMKAIGKDPAQSSNIILTTVTDCVGFFAFLSLAVLFSPLLVK